MMLQYRVKNNGEARTVTGLAVLAKDEERTFTAEEAVGFWRINGVPLTNENLPDDVECTLEVVPDRDETTEEG